MGLTGRDITGHGYNGGGVGGNAGSTGASGGGYSAVLRSSTNLIIAAGGGSGGGVGAPSAHTLLSKVSSAVSLLVLDPKARKGFNPI